MGLSDAIRYTKHQAKTVSERIQEQCLRIVKKLESKHGPEETNQEIALLCYRVLPKEESGAGSATDEKAREIVHERLARLTNPKDVELVWMVYRDGLTKAEIARRLGTYEMAVSRRLDKILKVMQD